MTRTKKLKVILILGIIFFVFACIFGLYLFSSDNDDYQMILDDDYHKPPVNVGKVIYDVDPEKWAREHPDTPVQLSADVVATGNFTANEKQVLDALNQILGQSYSKEWIRKTIRTNDPYINKWIYTWYPFTIAMYIETGIYPATQLFQSGLECTWGKSYEWRTDNNPTGMTITSRSSKAWECPGIGPVSCGNSRPADEGYWYQKFSSQKDGMRASAWAQAFKPLYKPQKIPAKPTSQKQLEALRNSGWVAKGEGGYDDMIKQMARNNADKLDEIGKQVKAVIANVNGGVDGNKPTGKADEWMPAGAQSQMKAHGVNMKVMTKEASDYVGFASKYIGTKYVFGAAEGQDKSFDCSSFVQWNYNNVFHINITRSTTSQEYAFQTSLKDKFSKVSIGDAKPGDLIYFGPDGGSHHVGIFLKDNGNGYALLLHASNSKPYPAGGVKIGTHKLGIYRIYRYKGMY